MTQPDVNITELDGALGVLPASAGRLLALVGVSSTGPINTPATFARVKDIVATYRCGPLVEAAAHYIDRYSRPVLMVRAANDNAGDVVDTVTHAATGTSAVTLADTDTEPCDDFQVAVQFTRDGTVGTAGAAYRISLDGGRTYGPTQSLGTAVTIAAVDGVAFALGAGTVKVGDTHSVETVAPSWTPANLGAALDALAQTAVQWEQAHIVGELTVDAVAALETKFAGMHASGRYRNWIGSARLPDASESEAAYLASVATALGSSIATTHGAIVAGACRATSGVSGRVYRRPFGWAFASIQGYVSEEINVADVNLGALPGVSIRDVNGNPDEHDESINPGLDDARFVTARTWDGYQGVYVNRPRLFSPETSDYQLVPHRRVINLAHTALRAYFIKRLNRPVIVSKKTGFILETEALEIEAGARAELSATLLAKPKASAVSFKLSRTDNLLSTKKLTGAGRVVPLAYPEDIELDVGFENPALQVQAV